MIVETSRDKFLVQRREERPEGPYEGFTNEKIYFQTPFHMHDFYMDATLRPLKLLLQS